MKTYLIISLIADDKPGLIEDLAIVVSNYSGNWLESNMSHLAGKFAGIFRVSVDDAKAELPLLTYKLSMGTRATFESLTLNPIY